MRRAATRFACVAGGDNAGLRFSSGRDNHKCSAGIASRCLAVLQAGRAPSGADISSEFTGEKRAQHVPHLRRHTVSVRNVCPNVGSSTSMRRALYYVQFRHELRPVPSPKAESAGCASVWEIRYRLHSASPDGRSYPWRAGGTVCLNSTSGLSGHALQHEMRRVIVQAEILRMSLNIRRQMTGGTARFCRQAIRRR